VVTEQGATLFRVQWEGRDLLATASDDGFAEHGCYGQHLMPWPGRVPRGVYEYEGERFQLPVTDHVTGAAIHGWTRWATWQVAEHGRDNLTLASADVGTSPRSVRLRDTLAKALWEQDSRRNIDAAIREEEVSWAIVEPLPIEWSTELPPTYLGIYYSFKADLMGGASNPQGRAWYEKSIAMLLRARAISQAAARAFDEAQLAHGKPLGGRIGMPELYLALGSDYYSLARYPEALEAFLQGRSLNPGMTMFYDGLADVYWAKGEYDSAAISLETKGMLEGFAPATLTAIARIYARIPDAACAVESRGAGPQINLNCPKVKSDLCLAASDLAQAFMEARNPAQARTFRAEAAQRYGCAM